MAERNVGLFSEFHRSASDTSTAHPGAVSGAPVAGPRVVGQEHMVSVNADEGVSAAHVLRRVEGAEVYVGVYSLTGGLGADQVVSLPQLKSTNL